MDRARTGRALQTGMKPRHLALAATPLLAAALIAAVSAQAPVTYRLMQIGPDTVPLVLRNAEGKALLTIVRESLTLGPGDRVLRVTTMHVDAYDRFPCDMLKELRARERAGAAATTAPSAPSADTTAAECAAIRTGTDSVAGTLGADGGRRVVTWTPAAGTRRVEARAFVVQRGEELELQPERQAGDSMPMVALRYRRAR